MRPMRRRQRGLALMVVVAVFLLAAITYLVSQSADLVAIFGRRFSNTEATQTQIQNALIRYVSVNGRLPCPADPTGATSPGVANGGTPQTAGAVCVYRTGVVPWETLGLRQPDVTDEWGRLISYRVFDGQYGLVQPNGMSATDCDTSNALTGTLAVGATAETPPDANGLCATDHNTLATSFISYPLIAPIYQKGLAVSDFGTAITDAAYVLISHGASGRGGYLPSGTQMLPTPSAGAGDLTNTAAPPAQFVKAAHSAPNISPDAVGHYDDVVSFLRIGDLLRLANRNARDWPDSMFNPQTTSDMTNPSVDPANPHFISSGSTLTGQAFAPSDVSASGTTLQAGMGVGAYSACLWWPNSLTLVSGTSRKKMATYFEFAATDNSNDAFPGFTMGFLSSTDPAAPPTNSTCGRGIAATTAASAAAGQFKIVVADLTGIQVGYRAFGNGIPFDARVVSVNLLGSVVELDAQTTDAVAGAVRFSDGDAVNRDLGWAGGSLALFTNRFAVEFDTSIETPASLAPGNDPPKPHLAIDFGGVVHGTVAGPCSSTLSGLPCDSQVTDFPAITVAATGTLLQSTITVSSMAGIANGMAVTGTSIPFGTTVTSASGSVVGLSQALTSNLAGNVTFAALPTTNFMKNGTSVFHGARVEISPKDCVEQTGTGVAGAFTLTVALADARQIQSGMSVFGNGIASGAKVSAIDNSTDPAIVELSKKHTAALSGKIVFGGAVPISTTAVGTADQFTVVVNNVTGIVPGLAVFGAGIGVGALVSSVAGTTVTVTVKNAADIVSGVVKFSPARTLVEAWTLSNAGCAQDPTSCGAMKSLNNNFAPNNTLEVSTTATGAIGTSLISAANATGILPSMSVSGAGIAANAYVVSISGTTITLSDNNTAAVSGDIVFKNRQALHAVSCIPAGTTANAYDSLYFGLTTANLTTSSGASTSASGAFDASTITVVSNAGITVGMSVRGTGIGDDAIVTGISGTTITLSAKNSAVVSGTVTFAGGANVRFRQLLVKDILLP